MLEGAFLVWNGLRRSFLTTATTEEHALLLSRHRSDVRK